VLGRGFGAGASIQPMPKARGSTLMGVFCMLATGCVPKGGQGSPAPDTPSSRSGAVAETPPEPVAETPPEPVTAMPPEPVAETPPEPDPPKVEAPPPTPPKGPFKWKRATTDGRFYLAVTVGQPAKRFAPLADSDFALPAVVLQEEPNVKARAVFRDSSTDGEGTGRWSLELTTGDDRWEIVDFATWITDCAAIDAGFSRDAIHVEARDLVPGGAKELVIRAREGHSEYLDYCNCTTRAGSSEHVWACGLVPDGGALRPVCWAHLETKRDIGSSMDVADCACAAKVKEESWSLTAELAAPGILRVTHRGRVSEHDLRTLPCNLASPPAVFGCKARKAAAAR
jgi:hypothetical protein